MMRTALLFGNAVLRTAALIAGLIHITGQLMAWNFYRPLAIIPGVVLLLCGVLPFRFTVQKRAPLFTIAFALVVAYVDSGLPFLQSVHDAPGRAFFFLEFLLLLAFLAIGLDTLRRTTTRRAG